MKKRPISKILSIVVLSLLLSCEGPQGPIGPGGNAGQNGTNGTNGANGTNGINGNANVVYSEWKAPVWTLSSTDASNYRLDQKDTSNGLITQEAIDKGIIYVYIKTKTLAVNPSTGKEELVDVITASPTEASHLIKIPGRTTNEIYDFALSNFSVIPQIRLNFLALFGKVGVKGFDKNFAFVTLPELVNKSSDYFNDLLKNDLKYRVVVAYGSTKGRKGNVDMNDYEAVKKAFNLAD